MFRLLGFDVRVRAGFVMFLALIVVLYQDAFGLWLAAALAGFTLVHELGHAVAARAAGAEAAISLDFLAGYTSFRPTRPIGRARRVVISAAGPLTQIATSVVVLLAIGVDPLSIDSVGETDLATAIWWAGPVIGLMNLIPVLPLDGGHLVETGLEVFLGERAMRVMAIASLAVTSGAAVVLFATGRGGFAIFVVFLLVHQFQLVQATSRSAGRRSVGLVDDAETAAWQTGRPGMLEPGQQLSPWYRAHRALMTGDRASAAAAVLDDLGATAPRRWSPPTAASASQLRQIVDVLPDRLPHGNPYSERVLAEILLATGDPERAGRYASESFTTRRHSTTAIMVARCAAALGDPPTALQWLHAARETAAGEPEPSGDVLAGMMDRAPEFRVLRGTAEYESLRAALA